MKTKFQQGKGRWNKEYWTACYYAEPSDKHWRYRKKDKCINIMFKYEEIAEIIETVLSVENEDKRPVKYKILKEALERGMNSPYKYNTIKKKLDIKKS
jgi:hypothetical protein